MAAFIKSTSARQYKLLLKHDDSIYNYYYFIIIIIIIIDTLQFARNQHYAKHSSLNHYSLSN